MKKNLMRGALLATVFGAIGLSGCMATGGIPRLNPYQGIPVGNYFSGNTIPSETYFADQDTKVVPHCEKYATETNPSAGRTAGAYGVNEGVAGFVGGASGMAADGAIVGGPVTAPVVLGSGVYYGFAAGAEGAETGAQASDQQVNAWTKYCTIANTAGYRSVAPSEREDLKRTGHSQSLEDAIAVDPYGRGNQLPPRPPG